MKFRSNKGKAVKNQFILSVGDEGAIFVHFSDGKLANKLFIDSPFSPDIKLMERLTEAYPKSPIYMLVDVIEQNYTQHVLPPVSAINVQQQIKRRIKRDFQPNDLNNVLPLGRSKEGRKDWNFLFISLANADPFAKWLDIVLNQKNDFGGVYLLPVEATKLLRDINSSSLSAVKPDWELLVLHNKTGGFRIIAFKEGKILFTRLAQNLIGENIAEITVGNMEQEISNTIEYLKRLAFRGEADSKITIVASAEVLQKVTPKSLKFGIVDLLTPHQLSQKLELPDSVSEKDKFSDILTATHFAVSRKHILRFNSVFTQKIETMYKAIKVLYIVTLLVSLSLVTYAGYEVYHANIKMDELDSAKLRLTQAQGRLNDISAKQKQLPKNVNKLVEVMSIHEMLPRDEFTSIRIINDIASVFNEQYGLTAILYQKTGTGNESSFELNLDVNLILPSKDPDILNTVSSQFLANLQVALPYYTIEYTQAPVIQNDSQLEEIKAADGSLVSERHIVAAKVKITPKANNNNNAMGAVSNEI